MKTCLGTMAKIARKAVSVVLVVLIALGTVALSSCGESSSLTITEEKEYYDNGAVKKETYSYPNGQASKICEYNEAGIMTSMVEYFEDGSIYKDYVINEAGAIIQIAEYVRYLADQAKRDFFSTTFYDENGRIVKYESFNEYVNYTAEYSEDGVCTKTFENKNETETTVETYEGNILRRTETTNHSEISGTDYKTVLSFNEKGNIIEKIEKYSTTDNFSREEYIYDEHNNIVKHIYFHTSDGTEEKLACIDYVNEYGTDGQLLKISVSGTFGPKRIITELGCMDRYTDYFENGILSKREGIYAEDYLDIADNAVEIYHKNGNIQCSISYHNGKESSRTEYYENGTRKIPKKYW